MKFPPRTEQEVSRILAEGNADFVVDAADENISKTSGNVSIKLTLRCTDKNFKTGTVFDYLSPHMEYKLRHFCVGTGLENEYETGLLMPSMCIGRRGTLKLKIEKAKDTYPDKNVVIDYLFNQENKANEPLSTNAQKLKDDDIPF